MAERHTVEKPQRTHDLIERRPGYPDRHQVYLEGADILQFETICAFRGIVSTDFTAS